MNVVKCENGHFYDEERYSVCPHCGAKMSSSNAVAVHDEHSVEEKPEKVSHRPFFKRKHKQKTIAPVYDEPSSGTKHGNSFANNGKGGDVTEVLEEVAFQADQPENQQLKTDKTVELWDLEQQEAAEAQNKQKKLVPDCTESVMEKERSSESSSLRDAIQRVSAGSEGKTVGVFSMGKDDSDDSPVDPVVGWLVCIEGKHFGESFNIFAGQNAIGRAVDNHIVLKKDKGISRLKHALIVYEPRKRNFYLQPGDSSGLTYLNDEYIAESKKLAPRDIVGLGDSRFMFIPLCGESFTWEDYMLKE